MAAVKEWRRAFEYADEKLKDDMRHVLVLACRKKGEFFDET